MTGTEVISLYALEMADLHFYARFNVLRVME